MSSPRLRWLLLPLGALALPASASEVALAWRFDAPQRFVITSQTVSSQVFQFNAEENLDKRIAEWNVVASVLCNVDDPLGKSWDLTCTIEDLALRVAVYPQDRDRAQEVVDEWDRLLTGTQVLMRHGPHGKVTAFELRGVKHTRNNDRIREIQEQMRLFLARPFSVFDMELPKKAVAVGVPWRPKAWTAMDFPSAVGTFGGMEVQSAVTSVDGSLATIESSGAGVRGPAVFDVRGAPLNLWDLKVYAKSTFDLKEGTLIDREITGQGTVTASSALATGTDVAPYVLAAKLQRIAPGETVEPLGPSEVFDARSSTAR